MLLITTLAIGVFCFVFYLIWSQFLKKETRLSVSLKVLHKKLDLADNFLNEMDSKVQRSASLIDKKHKELEKIVSEARFCIFKIEKMITSMNSTVDKKSNALETLQNKEQSIEPVQQYEKELISETQEEVSEPDTNQGFQFGDSPFSDVNFIETATKKKPPLDIST